VVMGRAFPSSGAEDQNESAIFQPARPSSHH
jgi:hypothetical protein